MNTIFTFVNSTRIKKILDTASERVVLVTPGLIGDVAVGLIHCSQRIELDKIIVIVDNSSQAMRNGYGNIEAIEELNLHKIIVRNQPNLRIGLLIVDDFSIIFNPLPQIVEAEPDSDDKPNALIISIKEAEKILSKIVYTGNGSPNLPEIGMKEVEKEEIKEIKVDLDKRPPIKPNLARQMWVISSKFQFVDMEFNGARPYNHSFSLSGKDLGIKNNALARRVSARYQLFEDKQIEVLKKKFNLEPKLNKIRDHFLIQIPSYGSVLYYQNNKNFLNAIEMFKSELNTSLTELRKHITEMLFDSRKKIFPWIRQNLKRLNKNELSEIIYPYKLENLDSFIESYLDKKFTTSDEIISSISFTLKITNVSDQLINDETFRKKIEDAFKVDFEKIVKTESAIGATDFEGNI